ncbi:MAG: outer membrane protein assembly factor BamE [Luminiphilus sp.]|jgi:outer membrane protein assembly factor BamE|nr:outer membrane protein assembly factor BamE [Luminiphilus sp.]MDG1461153.1 outer membrane protein assembly factor BamE [Luminiphilus sp.]
MPDLIEAWNQNPMALHLRSPLIPITLALALLSGCSGSLSFLSAYRIDVEQGNIVTTEMIEQLKPGMTRRQVRFVMGTPLIEDTFNTDRWDYRYFLRNGNKTLEESKLSVFFDGDNLINVSGSEVPDWANPTNEDSQNDAESEQQQAGV